MQRVKMLGSIVQSGARLTAGQGVVGLNPICHITFKGTDHEIISMAILPLPADSRSAVVSYWWKYVHKYSLSA